MPEPPRLVDLGDRQDDLDLLRRAHARVLAPSFGDDELMTADELVDAQPWPGQHVTVALGPDAEPVGVAVTHRGPDQEVELLTYLAVDPTRRSGGVGARLLAHLSDRWRASDVGLVVGEVHDPRAHAESPTERPAARLAFYGRNGATLLDLPWVQPALRPGSPPVHGMLLVVLHPRGLPAGSTVPAAPLRRWIVAAHGGEVGAGASDPAAILARLDGRDEVAVHTIGDAVPVAPLS